MSVHLDDYKELLEGLAPEEQERLHANWAGATRAFSPRGLDNYLKGAAALKGLGRGQAIVLAWIEQAPQVAGEVGEDVVGELAHAALNMASKTSGAVIEMMIATAPTAAARLGVPILASEQYPKGLGPTAAELKPLVPEGCTLEKIEFSCAANEPHVNRLRRLQRRQAVIAGIEAHVCVLQTALGLKSAGYDCFVVADAVGSRAPANLAAALARLRDSGIPVVTTEMVLFEWLGCAGTPEFKELSALIR